MQPRSPLHSLWTCQPPHDGKCKRNPSASPCAKDFHSLSLPFVSILHLSVSKANIHGSNSGLFGRFTQPHDQPLHISARMPTLRADYWGSFGTCSTSWIAWLVRLPHIWSKETLASPPGLSPRLRPAQVSFTRQAGGLLAGESPQEHAACKSRWHSILLLLEQGWIAFPRIPTMSPCEYEGNALLCTSEPPSHRDIQYDLGESGLPRRLDSHYPSSKWTNRVSVEGQLAIDRGS